ncbi:hypothetical protein AX761_13970 [Rhizobium sp. 58]|nr:hypothetical protein AX761_13970 [Rhizobium sp. 58]
MKTHDITTPVTISRGRWMMRCCPAIDGAQGRRNCPSTAAIAKLLPAGGDDPLRHRPLKLRDSMAVILQSIGNGIG